MDKIAITTDSACDLPVELVEKNGVFVLPLHVIFGEEEYSDGVDVTSKDIFQYIDTTGILPKTSACSVEEYREFFAERLQDHNFVIHLNISSGLSSTIQNASLAAQEFDGKVVVIDTKQLSSGQALLILKACELRDAGKSAQEIEREILDAREHIRLTCLVNKLDNLYKGGRCTAVASVASKILKIHPVITTKGGSLIVCKKYIGRLKRCVESYLNDLASEVGNCDPVGAFLVHTDCDDELIQTAKKIISEKFSFPNLTIATAGAVVSTHCGQGSMCIVYLEKKE